MDADNEFKTENVDASKFFVHEILRNSVCQIICSF